MQTPPGSQLNSVSFPGSEKKVKINCDEVAFKVMRLFLGGPGGS